MWKTFSVDDNLFMLKVVECDNDIEIILTNFTQLWSCKYSKKLLIQKYQTSNPLIEVKDEDALEQVIKLLEGIDKIKVSVSFADHTAKLSMLTNIAVLTNSEFTIKYELDFTKAENHSFLNVVTMPLIQTIILLEKQQDMIKNLLIKKDMELKQHLLEHDQISRSDLITEKFEPDNLVSSSEKLMLNIFGKLEKEITTKYGEIQEQVAEVEVKPWNNVKKKRRIYNKDTAAKGKPGGEIVYKKEKKT